MQHAGLRDLGKLANWAVGFLLSGFAVAAVFIFSFPVAVLVVALGLLVGLAIAVMLFAKRLGLADRHPRDLGGLGPHRSRGL